MKENNKGFTLIEVLATVTILGLLTTLVVVSYNTIVKRARVKYYQKQKELVIQAGREYFNDNHNLLPRKDNYENCVTLNTLISNKYIEKVKNHDKKDCNETESKVCAKKISETKYSYRAELNCYEN